MKKLLLMTGLVISGTATQANAYEVKNLCVKYQSNFEWTRSQPAEVSIFSGDELNDLVGYYNKYNMFDHYAVVLWENETTSVIKLEGFYSPGMMILNTRGTDQNGRSWQLSDNNIGYCY